MDFGNGFNFERSDIAITEGGDLFQARSRFPDETGGVYTECFGQELLNLADAISKERDCALVVAV